MKLMAFPTWVLMKISILFLPKEHPWYGKRFTLTEWNSGQTVLCKEMDRVFWVGFLIIVFTALAIFFRD